MAALSRNFWHESLNTWAQLTFELSRLNKWAHHGPVACPRSCCLARWPLARPQKQASAQRASYLMDVYQPPANTKNGSRPPVAEAIRSAPFDTPPVTGQVTTDRRPACSSDRKKVSKGGHPERNLLTQTRLEVGAVHSPMHGETAVQTSIAPSQESLGIGLPRHLK